MIKGMLTKPLEIASVPRQILILLWKNAILFRRNLFSTFLEIFCPLLLLSILLIMRFFIEKINYTDQNNLPHTVLNFVSEVFQLSLKSQFTINRINRNLIVYYPNTTIIEGLVSRAASSIALNNQGFYPSSKAKRKFLFFIFYYFLI